MVGVNGKKFPDIRQHLDQNIGQVYRDMDLTYDNSHSFKHLTNTCLQF